MDAQAMYTFYQDNFMVYLTWTFLPTYWHHERVALFPGETEQNQNLARFKPVQIYLTLLEHPLIRLRANVPDLFFDRGKDGNAFDRLTLF
jgi:hypothetical protein